MREHRMTAGVGRTIPRGCDPPGARGRLRCVETRGPRAPVRTAHGENAVQLLLRLCADRRRRAPSRAERASACTRSPSAATTSVACLFPSTGRPVAGAAQAASGGRSTARALCRGDGDRQGAIRSGGADWPRARPLSQPERDRTLRHRPARIPREPVDDGRGTAGPLAVVKFVVEANGTSPKVYRTILIRLTCGRPGELRVASAARSHLSTGRHRSP